MTNRDILFATFHLLDLQFKVYYLYLFNKCKKSPIDPAGNLEIRKCGTPVLKFGHLKSAKF